MLDVITIPQALALALLAGAAFTDARTGHIPNHLTLPVLAVAPIGHLVFSGLMAAASSLVAAVVCALVPYLMFRRGAAGGGDVKLLAAVGALCGATFGLESQLFGFGFAVLFSLARLAYRGKLLKTLCNSLLLFLSLFLPRRFRKEPAVEAMETVRMGVFFFAGALFSVWLRGMLVVGGEVLL